VSSCRPRLGPIVFHPVPLVLEGTEHAAEASDQAWVWAGESTGRRSTTVRSHRCSWMARNPRLASGRSPQAGRLSPLSAWAS